LDTKQLLNEGRMHQRYSGWTFLTLVTSIISSLLGALGNVVFQGLALVSTIIGLALLFGQLFLVIMYVDKENGLGGILHRMAYSILFLLLLSALLLILMTYFSAFYVLGEYSLQANLLVASMSITIVLSFGICFSSICYHSLWMQGIWTLDFDS
jgi:hypothetical protein